MRVPHSSCTPVEAVVFGLATFRLARLVGPDEKFPPTVAARAWLQKRLGDSHPVVAATNCPWCSSVYVAVVLALGWRWAWFRRALWIPAASAAAGLLTTADSALGRAWPESSEAPASTGISRALAARLPSSWPPRPLDEREADVGYP